MSGRRSAPAAWVVLLATLSGCALLGRPAVRLPATTAADLLESLATRRTATSSMRARARVREGVASMWTREAVLVRRPDALRIDVLTPFGLAMAIGADGTTLWAYPPSEGVRYEGPASAENLSRFIGAPIVMTDLVDVLLGLPPARIAAGTPRLETTLEREYRLTIPLGDGAQQLWFSGDPLVLVRAEEVRTDRPKLQVAFSEHEDGMPRLIEVVVPTTGNTVTLRYDQVERNPTLDDSIFAPPAAAAVRPFPNGSPG